MVRRAVAAAGAVGVLIGVLGACSSGADSAPPAKSQETRRQTEPLSRAGLKKMLLAKSELPETLAARYTQIWPTTTVGKRLKASESRCQPLADAIRPGSTGHISAKTSQRFVETPEEFVTMDLVSYSSVKEASAVMDRLESAVPACPSPLRIGENSEDSDPYRGARKKTVTGQGDQTVSYYLRKVSYADHHESPELFVHIRVGNVIATFKRYASYKDNVIPPALIRAQTHKIQTT
ncbi:sensor domain-containing protein [Streptomyces reniochalinae]|uniref:Sensor domain-containing protein n=1 Tax=Streptomyces reniochalinae TaxID=2250578 RepID=A0A367E7C7_9ACTN|nr:sensor domain-containing protein [Streptomyces reniochalinae]